MPDTPQVRRLMREVEFTINYRTSPDAMEHHVCDVISKRIEFASAGSLAVNGARYDQLVHDDLLHEAAVWSVVIVGDVSDVARFLAVHALENPA